MALSIAIVKSEDGLSLQLGGWESMDEANDILNDSGSEELVIALEKYKSDSDNAGILEAMALSAGDEFAIGRDLEKLLNFAFELGRKIER